VLALARGFNLSPDTLRSELCIVLLRTPDQNNWSSDNVAREVEYLIEHAPWYRVYDIAERLHDIVERHGWGDGERFADRLNDVFREIGVGYEMKDGRIVGRGSLAFREATEEAVRIMATAYKPTAAGDKITLLGPDGAPGRELGAGAGLVAATGYQDDFPTWMITGTDDVGVAAAAAALNEDQLRFHFALAIDGGRGVSLPLETPCSRGRVAARCTRRGPVSAACGAWRWAWSRWCASTR
jgi:hypothetical protein